MSRSIWYYLKNVFINPVAAGQAITRQPNLWPLIIVSFFLGVLPYWLIVLLGYRDLGWDAFPYKQYYPYYFDPYWWEMLVVPVWGLVLGLGFAIPGYYFGKALGGQASFTQVVAIVMLATVVSLPVFVFVDLFFWDPQQIITFATTGMAAMPLQPGDNVIVWLIRQTYAYVAMGWQGIATLIGLAAVHRISWLRNIPGVIAGNAVFVFFLLLIRDYVALII